jgi:hypothetical protein
MMSREYRDRVETSALLLDDAWWLLERAFLRLIALADIQRAQAINRIMTTVDAERRRWLRSADSPIP